MSTCAATRSSCGSPATTSSGSTRRWTRPQNRFDVGEVTRTDVSQSQSRLAASRSTLAGAEGQLEVSRQAYLAAVGMLPDNLEPLPPLPQMPNSLDEAAAIGVQRNPRIISAQFSERAAVYDFDRALARQRAAGRCHRRRRLRARQHQFGGWDGDTFGEVGIQGSMPLYTGGATTAWSARRRRCSISAASSCRTRRAP